MIGKTVSIAYSVAGKRGEIYGTVTRHEGMAAYTIKVPAWAGKMLLEAGFPVSGCKVVLWLDQFTVQKEGA